MLLSSSLLFASSAGGGGRLLLFLLSLLSLLLLRRLLRCLSLQELAAGTRHGKSKGSYSAPVAVQEARGGCGSQ